MPTPAMIEAARKEFWRVLAIKDLTVEDAWSAALEAAEAAGWEKIETAPKDGTVFDAWLGDASQSDVDFYCTPGTRRSPSWHWYIGKFRPVGGLHSITDPPIPIFVQPTYWRPLPSPPAVQEEP